MKSTLIIIADDIRQRHALKDVGQSYGFEVIHCLSSKQLDTAIAALTPSLWLIDVEEEHDLLEHIGFDQPILMGLLNAPAFNQRPQYLSWKKKIGVKLLNVLGQPQQPNNATQHTALSGYSQQSPSSKIIPDVWRVVLLAGSMGGVESIKAFLDSLPSDLPFCFLLVQHIDPYMQQRLPHILSRHNQWQVEMISHQHTVLKKGVVYVVPATQQIHFDLDGTVLLNPSEDAWPGCYQPSIHEVMYRASRIFKQQLLTIVFSGMGDDGSQAAAYHVNHGGLIWAQTALSCASSSQPDQMRATGHVSFNDTPLGLAAQLIYEYEHNREKVYEYPVS
jgi:chemosensory pili system protein ChpB (putative protein-glutamate methylesterase)